jgi:hypothetical protein
MSDSTDIDLLTASLRADAADSRAMIEALAARLEGDLPHLVKVHRRGFRGRGGVDAIDVALDDKQLRLSADGTRLTASVGTVSGGIVIKKRQLGVDEWLAELAAGLARVAEHDAKAGAVISSLLTA